MRTIVLRVECMMIFPMIRIGSAETGPENPCLGRATTIEHVAKVGHAWGQIRFASGPLRDRPDQAMCSRCQPCGKFGRRTAWAEERVEAQP
jgi:hypothetical protein